MVVRAARDDRGAGIRALGSVTGADIHGKAPSAEVLRELLAGRAVVLWSDADEPNRVHMRVIADRLRGVAASVRVVSWTEAPKGGDAHDAIAAGVNVEQLIASAGPADAPPSEAVMSEPVIEIGPPPDLALNRAILDTFADEIAAAGLAGECKLVQIIYLAVTSRLLDRIVSVAVKGPSAVGKSFAVERVLDYFPPSAYYALSAMSEHALVYDREPLRHRTLVIYKAAGLASDLATYMVRSLLSEGHVRYVTVEKVKGGSLEPRVIDREGPTALIVTTTEIKLHPESETRLLSLNVTDSAEQTRAVLLAQAGDRASDEDLGTDPIPVVTEELGELVDARSQDDPRGEEEREAR